MRYSVARAAVGCKCLDEGYIMVILMMAVIVATTAVQQDAWCHRSQPSSKTYVPRPQKGVFRYLKQSIVYNITLYVRMHKKSNSIVTTR